MSSEEDDYMSDNILAGINDVRPGLLFSKSQKRSHELMTKKESVKKSKTVVEQEKESRQLGLDTPLAEDNKGFKLLMKMGFKPGNKIGSNKDGAVGLSEPIKVVVKDTKTGLGHDTEIKEKTNLIIQKRKEKDQQLYNDFRKNAFQKRNEQLINRDYRKVQKICQDLDIRNDIDEPLHSWYWPKVEKESESEEEDKEDEEEEEVVVTVEDIIKQLSIVISYLRDKYNYCMYCAVQFNNGEDMQQNCPGPSREEHDDE